MSHPTINFTPGPSQLYFTVADHARSAFREGIPSLSHRSKAFERIYQETSEGLRELLQIPKGFHVLFTGSATEIWERVIQNLVEENSFHFVNGSFSKRFYEIARQLNKRPGVIEAEMGYGFAPSTIIPAGTEMVAITHNETSTGVMLPLSYIDNVRTQAPDSLIVVDAVSSLPYPAFDYSKIDSVFFSVQKGFGLPAGLGVWIVNDRCLQKAESLLAKGISIGSYHNLPSLHSHAMKNQTPETPNVLAIYLLSKVVADMNRHGIDRIRKETEYKATLLYHLLDKHPKIKAFVKDKAFQSRTVIVADTGALTPSVTTLLNENGMHPGDGYGASKKSQLRFANFPTHSREDFELLVDTLEKV